MYKLKTEDYNFKWRKFSYILAIFVFTITLSSQESEWVVLTEQNSPLPNNYIYTIRFDSEGTAWIGTGGGLVKLKNGNWEIFTVQNSAISSNAIRSIGIDNEDNLWVGTSNGVNFFDGTNWLKYTTSNSDLPANTIHSITIIDDAIWLGTQGTFTYEGGVVKIVNDSWTVFNTANSNLTSNWIYEVSADKDKNIWVGGLGCLAKYENYEWIIYNNYLPETHVKGLGFDDYNQVWVGTYGGGVVQYTGEDWIIHDFTSSGVPDFTRTIAVHDGYDVWVGTGAGIRVYLGGWFSLDPNYEHLPHWEINTIQFDENRNMWIGTRGGLAIYNNRGVVNVEENNNSIKQEFILSQNYPNPFNPSTLISYTIPTSQFVQLKVFDVLGGEIVTLIDDYKMSGTYEVKFDASKLSSGIYFYKLICDELTITKKMLLVR